MSEGSQPPPPHEPQLFAFLFCRDVIEEKDETVTPLRLIEGAEYGYVPPGAIWLPLEVNAFMGVSCDDRAPYVHQLTLEVSGPKGDSTGKATVETVFGGDSTVVYRNIHLDIPTQVPGAFCFKVFFDGRLTSTRLFTIKHNATDSSASSNAESLPG
jgi:hypothetical protein